MKIGIINRLSCVLAGGDVPAIVCLLLHRGAEQTVLDMERSLVLPQNIIDVRNTSLVPPKSAMTCLDVKSRKDPRQQFQ